MNVTQSIGASIMVWGCALPVCFTPDTEYINIIGLICFGVGVAIFIGGSEDKT